MTAQKLLTTLLKDTPPWFRISLSLLLAVAIFITSIVLENPDLQPTAVSQQGEIRGVQSDTTFLVTDVVDGDTIKVLIDDEIKTVRLVNMNTPETVHPTKKVECFGVESSQRMKALALNAYVTLEIDPTQQNTDRYGRLLRFVFLQSDDENTPLTDLGLQLIEEGFAHSSPYGSSPHPYLEQYEAAQKRAQENKVGLWSESACQ